VKVQFLGHAFDFSGHRFTGGEREKPREEMVTREVFMSLSTKKLEQTRMGIV
jgi:hypothetical protein